jgi:hypothetical protein
MNVTRNESFLRCLGNHVAEVLCNEGAPHTDDWARLLVQFAVRIRKG